jgi:hypothetical protein
VVLVHARDNPKQGAILRSRSLPTRLR